MKISDLKSGDVVHVVIPEAGSHALGIERITEKAVFFHTIASRDAKEADHELFQWWLDETVKATGGVKVDRALK